jgi:hypothetical protein
MKLHSISSNYLVFDDSWDELAIEQDLRSSTFKEIVFISINLSSFFLTIIFFLYQASFFSLFFFCSLYLCRFSLLDGQQGVYIGLGPNCDWLIG